MIPDLAKAMLSREPPSASICSSPIVVIIDAASPELEITFVASRAPPSPACNIRNKQNYHYHALTLIGLKKYILIQTSVEG